MNLGEHSGDGIRHSMHLSAPKGWLAQMLRDPDGQWVPYADYAALQAENERIRKERDKLDFKESCEYKRREEWEKACIEARAENERLRKAGDAMELLHLHGPRLGNPFISWRKALRDWHAAKEVQP